MDVKEAAVEYLLEAVPQTREDDVPPGYKRTDVGVIPEDWLAEVLGKYATFRTGPFGSSLHRSDYVEGGVPIVNPMQIIDGRLVPSSSMSVSEEAAKRLSDFRLPAGSVVIGRRGDMGRCAFVDTPYEGWLCGTGSMIIRPRPSADGRFLQRLLSSHDVIAAIENSSVGTTMINLNQGTLAGLVLALPPTVAEQRAIATALSDADALIAALQRLIAKKRAIKQGTMQALLTGRQRLPGFTGEWASVHAGDVGSFRGGNGFPVSFQGQTSGAYPFFKVSDMSNEGNTTFMLHANNYIDERVRKSIGATAFPARSIVFAKIGAAVFLERKRILSKPSCIDNNLAGFVVDDSMADYRFIHYVLTGISFGSLANTTALPSLGGKTLAAIELELPPPDEQTAIATVLADMDAAIEALEARLTKARALKAGMMQQLLTGRIRLPLAGAA